MSQTQTRFDSIEEQVSRSYRDVDYTITRTADEEYTSGFEYEFVLCIDGAKVATASELEARGYVNPWIPALDSYARAYIDGLLSGA